MSGYEMMTGTKLLDSILDKSVDRVREKSCTDVKAYKQLKFEGLPLP